MLKNCTSLQDIRPLLPDDSDNSCRFLNELDLTGCKRIGPEKIGELSLLSISTLILPTHLQSQFENLPTNESDMAIFSGPIEKEKSFECLYNCAKN